MIWGLHKSIYHIINCCSLVLVCLQCATALSAKIDAKLLVTMVLEEQERMCWMFTYAPHNSDASTVILEITSGTMTVVDLWYCWTGLSL